MEAHASSTITLDSFNGKSVFITGVTGFVGKVLLEKILRSVPSVERIHLLIRGNRRYPSAAERFQQEVATSSIFDLLKGEDETAFKRLCERKLRFVSGELTAERFGLSEAAFNELAYDVDLVINSAASVNFREPLNDALATNTLSLHTIIQLTQARKTPVVHVSTCYVNGYHEGLIPETVAGPARAALSKAAGGYYKVEPLIEHLQSTVEAATLACDDPAQHSEALVEAGLREADRYGWNDTYTFTKWIGEQLLLQHMQGQALTILRPSIVESTLHEPTPGWIEGVKVADAIIMAYARQKVTYFPGDPRAVIDIIPVDLVANSIILAGAEALMEPPCHRIYQCSTSSHNPVSINEVIQCVVQEGKQRHREYPNLFASAPRRPFVMIPGWAFHGGLAVAYRLLAWKQSLFSWLGAAVSSSQLSNLDAMVKLALIFSFYTRPRYRFSNENLCALAARAGAREQEILPVATTGMDWQHYLQRIHLPGLNRYALRPRAIKAAGFKKARARRTAVGA
ncbi:MAG: fatty acyl-CoA reductase [Pseudomonadota bacterium]|nr:fatty acyl-CoA reductase [Pseudomonadota bacterium]